MIASSRQGGGDARIGQADGVPVLVREGGVAHSGAASAAQMKGVVDASIHVDFAALHVNEGRPAIASGLLPRACHAQILYSIRSETQLMEQLQYNMVSWSFVGLSFGEWVRVATVFTKGHGA